MNYFNNQNIGLHFVEPPNSNVIIGRSDTSLSTGNILIGNKIYCEGNNNVIMENNSVTKGYKGDNMFIINGMDIKAEFKKLTDALADLRRDHLELKEKYDELYYAPGGPGFYEAEKNFVNIINNKHERSDFTRSSNL